MYVFVHVHMLLGDISAQSLCVLVHVGLSRVQLCLHAALFRRAFLFIASSNAASAVFLPA